MSMYKAIAYNKYGTNGESYTKDGLEVTLAPLTSEKKGTNPEELLALSWAACLNATARSILNLSGKTNKIHVRVEVDLEKDVPKGLIFKPVAYMAVEGFTLEEAKFLAEKAHKHCPVSKLLSLTPGVTVNAVSFDEIFE
ncbi:OsmC/Ohr family protein [Alteracholeplasma palmae J233]|uniref:OsmC/Ohr family protein n=1 Tax=Alteracholeplasma palmae (strain ATCC 49389 / J233) TaxID=1318466 RepID=U4KLZ6_ALTPJ|nr:OsmC family protein [Alteracholeplasma palmae]CCV64958.1 OsmC/Ohr family protein [Alteracholeplasma palmae J233]